MGGEDQAQQQQAAFNAPPPAASYPPQGQPPQAYGAVPQPQPQYAQPYPMQGQPQVGYQYAPGYQQLPQGAPMVAPMGAPVVAILPQEIRFRENPVVCTCPFCGNNGPTRLDYVSGTLTWLAFGGLCLVGCWLGCCLIPFAVDGCKDVEHHCGSCQRVVGVFRRIS